MGGKALAWEVDAQQSDRVALSHEVTSGPTGIMRVIKWLDVQKSIIILQDSRILIIILEGFPKKVV